MEIFKISYTWFEGDFDETHLGKDVEKKEFERDLKEAKEFAKSLLGKKIKQGEYLGKGYNLECLPEFYSQIIWFLINKKGYIKCEIDSSEYDIDDWSNEINVERIDNEIKRTRI
jgi:hypothetical protein